MPSSMQRVLYGKFTTCSSRKRKKKKKKPVRLLSALAPSSFYLYFKLHAEMCLASVKVNAVKCSEVNRSYITA